MYPLSAIHCLDGTEIVKLVDDFYMSRDMRFPTMW